MFFTDLGWFWVILFLAVVFLPWIVLIAIGTIRAIMVQRLVRRLTDPTTLPETQARYTNQLAKRFLKGPVSLETAQVLYQNLRKIGDESLQEKVVAKLQKIRYERHSDWWRTVCDLAHQEEKETGEARTHPSLMWYGSAISPADEAFWSSVTTRVDQLRKEDEDRMSRIVEKNPFEDPFPGLPE